MSTRAPEVSRLDPDDPHGHLEELRTDPIGLLHRVREECGDVGRFTIVDRDVTLVAGSEVNEAFFRAPDEVLDQAAAYPFMTPIFGKGVVFDAPPEQRKQALRNQALRGDMMRGHATTIENEIRRMVAPWYGLADGEEVEIDLLDFFAELTIYTTSACLIGRRFREQIDGRFADLYHDLERGTDAWCFVDPYADIDSFRRRDAAREGLVELVQSIIDARLVEGEVPREERDLLDVLISLTGEDGSPHFSTDEITGMFISMMFAGHHTSSGTAAWTLIELLRNPDVMADVVAELDALYADPDGTGAVEVSFQALREIPRLEAALKETLRLHPPLILLLRVATEDFEIGGHTVPAGQLVGASPRVSNRLASDFPEPDRFDPGRYVDPRQEDLLNRWTWIPFGAGRHRCVGNAFAMMQLKAIFSVLLRDFEVTPAQDVDSYRDDTSKMVVQLAQPCRATVRRRAGTARRTGETSAAAAEVSVETATGEDFRTSDAPSGPRVEADLDLCQGHQMCQDEAPGVLGWDEEARQVVVLDAQPGEERREDMQVAVRSCPAMALTLTEENEENA
jgi:sterol 14-demethylase